MYQLSRNASDYGVIAIISKCLLLGISLFLCSQPTSAFVPSKDMAINSHRARKASLPIVSWNKPVVQSNTYLHVFSNLFQGKIKNEEPLVIAGVGDDGCALPSPSGVNMLPGSKQIGIFLAIYAGLGVGTYLLSSFLEGATLQYEWIQSWKYTWPLLGAIYALAGVTHFTLEEEYINIYPSKGAWGGLWVLPGSAKFHVQWTGIAEVLGGIGLLIGGFYDAFAPVYTQFPNVLTPAGIGSDSAAALFLLTLAVTPANIYMFTHGAKLPKETPDGEPGPEVPISGHAIRGALQIILLSLLYQMGEGTFDSLVNGIIGCPTC